MGGGVVSWRDKDRASHHPNFGLTKKWRLFDAFFETLDKIIIQHQNILAGPGS